MIEERQQIELNYKPQPHQLRFHRSKAYERIMISGFGSGKSYMGCAEAIRLAFKNYGLASLIVCLSYPVARRTILPTLKQLLDSSNINYTHNKSNFTFTIHDAEDHIMYLGSSEVPTSLKGSNVSFVYFDEVASMPIEAYQESIARAREPRSKEIRIFSTTTPDAMNWVYQEFIKTKRDDLEVIRATTYDNSFLPETYIKSLESRYSAELRQAYLMGEFVDATGKVINPKWFKFFNGQYADKRQSVIHYSVDTSYGVEEGDETSILEWSIIGNYLWLWNYHGKVMDFPTLTKYINTLVTSHPLHGRSLVYVEPKSSGLSVIQQMKENTRINIVADTAPKESKYARAISITGMLEAGRVLLNPQIDWTDWLFQLSQFSGNENTPDDHLDTLIMACSKLQSLSWDMSEVVIKEGEVFGSPGQPRGNVLSF